MNKTLTVAADVSISRVEIKAEVHAGTPIRAETAAVTKVAEEDYSELKNKPSIEHVVLEGDNAFEDLGLKPINIDDLLRILT